MQVNGFGQSLSYEKFATLKRIGLQYDLAHSIRVVIEHYRGLPSAFVGNNGLAIVHRTPFLKKTKLKEPWNEKDDEEI